MVVDQLIQFLKLREKTASLSIGIEMGVEEENEEGENDVKENGSGGESVKDTSDRSETSTGRE